MTTSASVSEVHPDWRRNQAAVTIATFVGFAGFTLVMPFLPIYLEELGEHRPSMIAIWSGICLGITPAITAGMAPLSARMADRRGRKFMVIRSLSGFVVIMGLMAVVTAPWQVLTLRALLGLVAGYGPIAMTMAAESAPPEEMAAAIGWVQTAQRLGPALGPVLGGLLVGAVGLRAGFLVAAVVYLAAVILVAVGVRETGGRLPRTTARVPMRESWLALRQVPHFVLLLGTVFGLQLVDRSFGPVLPLYLREVGIEAARVPFQSGVLFTTMAASAAVGNQMTAWILERGRPAVVVAIGATTSAIAALIFGVGASMTLLLVMAIVFGLGIGIATTAVYTVAGQGVSAAERGYAFGYLTTAYLAALAISPVVAGFIGSTSMRAVFIADAAGLALIAWLAGRGIRG